MKIKVLGADIYNQIAAGEVVDRPYSVVKELVENAIDAGATRISVEIEGGGKSLVRVTDNGCGIEREDLINAYRPHATSKLSRAEDLFGIQTLGFRGEAIASVAAVSEMRILSRTEESGEGYALSSRGGVLGEVVPAPSPVGTQVTVENLFFNTPARLKFLKSDAQEEGDVSNMMVRFVLSRPEISFTFTANGKEKLATHGEGLAAAIAAVYGMNILGDLFEINADKHGIRLSGFIGDQNFSKPNRTYQSLFVNGRYVINQTVATAVTNAYASYLMKRQYPFYVLFLDLPAEIVDVNVHPNKADVRFADNRLIYGTVYHVISSVLDGNSRALEYLVPRTPKQQAAATGTMSAPSPSASPAKGAEAPVMTYEEAKKELRFEVPLYAGKVGLARPAAPMGLEVHASGEKRAPEEDVFEENRKFLREQEKKAQRVEVASLEYKGELFRTYLFYECGEDAYIVDQHAAHERLIYDKLREKLQRREIVSQPMLVPFVLTLNGPEFAFLFAQFPILTEMGFDISEFGGNTVKVSALPADLMEMDLDAFFREVLGSYESLRAIRLPDLLKDKLASAACKAAVKGGEMLTEQEVKALLRRMDGDMGLKCPHGRPVAVHLKKSEMEKLFKRIV